MRVIRKDGMSRSWPVTWQVLFGVPSTLLEPLCLAEGGGNLLYRLFGESLQLVIKNPSYLHAQRF